MRFLEQVVRAVVAGAVIEVSAPGRSRVEITLDDGRVERSRVSDAPVGCLPLPGWVRWGRSVRYEPYS